MRQSTRGDVQWSGGTSDPRGLRFRNFVRSPSGRAVASREYRINTSCRHELSRGSYELGHEWHELGCGRHRGGCDVLEWRRPSPSVDGATAQCLARRLRRRALRRRLVVLLSRLSVQV